MGQRRRGWGEGSVYERKDGKFVAQVSYLDEASGKRRYRRATAATRRLAVAKLKELEAQAATEGAQTPITFENFFRAWVADVLPEQVKESTRENYLTIAKAYLFPALGRLPLERVSPAEIQRILRSIADSGRSPRTAQLAYAVLHRSLEYAVRSDQLANNPCSKVDRPRSKSREMATLSRAELDALLRAATDDRLGAIFVLAVSTGMRKGELLALKWSDVDLDRAELHVRSTLRRSPDKGLVTDAPKTRQSRRVVVLPALATSALGAHKRRQAEEQLEAGPAWHRTGHVFATEIGTPIDPRNLDRTWHRVREAAGISDSVRFHDLRHSAATFLLESGVPIEIISKLLGHSGVRVTADVYGHLTRRLQEAAAAAMDGVLGGSSTK